MVHTQEQRFQDIIHAFLVQRDKALSDVVNVMADNAALQREIADLTKQLEEAKKPATPEIAASPVLNTD